MTLDDALRQRWMAFTRPWDAEGGRAAEVFAQIAARYGEPHRAYHNLRHLDALFADLDRFAVRSIPVEFAVWFHDIIYRPLSGNNEARSATVAVWGLRRIEVEAATVKRVEQLIVCTRRHRNPDGDPETQLFLDADMAILGTTPDAYRRYVDSIQQEFANMPGPLFRRGRLRFLRALADAERIYGSEPFHAAYEDRARANIAWELGQR